MAPLPLRSTDNVALRSTIVRRRHRSEHGLTLVEVLVTIAILTIGVVGIVGGVGAAQRISGINQAQAQLEPAMRQLSDYVRDSSLQGLHPYIPCANTTNNQYSLAGLGLAPTGLSWSITKVAVSVTNGGTRNGVATPPLQTCASGADWGVQEITLQVRSATRSLTRVIWKADA
jgi:prepilin-type N-terminal cleavage/methylation domain-containing protein